MNLQEILAIIQAVNLVLENLGKLGVNLSGVQLHTSSPIDLLTLFRRP